MFCGGYEEVSYYLLIFALRSVISFPHLAYECLLLFGCNLSRFCNLIKWGLLVVGLILRIGRLHLLCNAFCADVYAVVHAVSVSPHLIYVVPRACS